MKKETLLIVVLTLVIGVLVGILVSKGGKSPGVSRQTSSAPAAPAVNLQQEIKLLEEMVAKDPSNRNAWVELGHKYFDSDNPMKAVEAYNRALELDANDPNVLTDQGVMFRRLGWFDRAIENFEKANRLNPSHPQSLYNLGVVYRYDLQNFAKAREVWTRYLEINSVGPGADQIRRELEFLSSQPGASANQ